MSINPTTIQMIVVAAVPLLFAITIHEVAHGWVAKRCGDNTAFMLGRITLNPMKHIDLLGTIILPMLMLMLGGVIFGWAKPVPVTWQNLRNPRRDMALVALAGPGINLVMALFWAIIMKLSILITASDQSHILFNIKQFFYTAGYFGIFINIVLMTLNLLPIPPLDGSRLVSSLLPPGISVQYDKLEPYGIWILLALLFFGILNYILWPPIQFFVKVIITFFKLN